eukprot:TRINITY_DN5245_c0_g1_i1.p1 TRINITY_DN5245_c0_g1~~TRINITY_DN5245_c0_g1_i1.p1  ORF type:complete len:727 (-),score=154.16 TRINITY_DN5245_c0_g1_i1:246-2426(-)
MSVTFADTEEQPPVRKNNRSIIRQITPTSPTINRKDVFRFWRDLEARNAEDQPVTRLSRSLSSSSINRNHIKKEVSRRTSVSKNNRLKSARSARDVTPKRTKKGKRSKSEKGEQTNSNVNTEKPKNFRSRTSEVDTITIDDTTTMDDTITIDDSLTCTIDTTEVTQSSEEEYSSDSTNEEFGRIVMGTENRDHVEMDIYSDDSLIFDTPFGEYRQKLMDLYLSLFYEDSYDVPDDDLVEEVFLSIIRAERKYQDVTFEKEDSEENIVYDENDNKLIRLATIEKLVEKVTGISTKFDIWLVLQFLLTYHTAAKPVELMMVLRLRYMKTNNNVSKLRVLNFIKKWMSEVSWDWTDNPLVLDLLLCDIYETDKDVSTKKHAKILIDTRIHLKKRGYITNSVLCWGDNEQPPIPEIPTELSKNWSLMEISSLELARQLTLIDFELWMNIRPWDCMDSHKFRGPSVLASVNHFNRVSQWVATEILTCTNTFKMRASLIEKFIDIADHCANLHNYTGCMAILGGLDHLAIRRLSTSWGMISKYHTERLNEMKVVTSTGQNFQELRDIVAELVGRNSAVPYLGLYLSDLVRVDAGGLKKIDGLINFTLCRRIAAIVIELINWSRDPYRFLWVTFIRDRILGDDLLLLSTDTLYDISTNVEPKSGREPTPVVPKENWIKFIVEEPQPLPSSLLVKYANGSEYADIDGTSIFKNVENDISDVIQKKATNSKLVCL